MHKKDIIRLLETIAVYMELKGTTRLKYPPSEKRRQLWNRTTEAYQKWTI